VVAAVRIEPIGDALALWLEEADCRRTSPRPQKTAAHRRAYGRRSGSRRQSGIGASLYRFKPQS